MREKFHNFFKILQKILRIFAKNSQISKKFTSFWYKIRKEILKFKKVLL